MTIRKKTPTTLPKALHQLALYKCAALACLKGLLRENKGVPRVTTKAMLLDRLVYVSPDTM